jgi:hypothetical protein
MNQRRSHIGERPGKRLRHWIPAIEIGGIRDCPSLNSILSRLGKESLTEARNADRGCHRCEFGMPALQQRPLSEQSNKENWFRIDTTRA